MGVIWKLIQAASLFFIIFASIFIIDNKIIKYQKILSSINFKNSMIIIT